MSARTFASTLLAIVPLTVLACSSGSSLPPGLQNTGNGGPPPGGGSGATGTDAAAVGSDSGATTPVGCTTLDLNTVGPCETFKASGEAEPIGGTIVSGTYGIESATVYGGDAGAATCDIRYEITFDASTTTTGTVQVAYELGQEELLTTASGTYSTSGNVLTFVFTCEAFNGTETTATTTFAAYTASGATLDLYGTPFSSTSSAPTTIALSNEYVLGLR